MTNLIDQVPAAKAFVDAVRRDVSEYLLWPGEEFAEHIQCVLATTGLDLQGESFPLAALESHAEAIRSNRIWFGVRHDPFIHPVGRPLDAEVFLAHESGMHFLAAVVGIYEPSKIQSFASAGIQVDETDTSELEAFGGLEEGHVKLCASPFEIEDDDINELLRYRPSLVSRMPRRAFRKSAQVDVAIIELLVPLKYLAAMYIASNNPASRKALEVIGEALGKSIVELFAWIRTRVVVAAKKLKGKKKVLAIRTRDGQATVEFLVDCTDDAHVLEAVDALPDGVYMSRRLIARIRDLQPDRVAFAYDAKLRKWLPLYAATRKRGVIADRPHLICISELRGVSVGGLASVRRQGPRAPARE